MDDTGIGGSHFHRVCQGPLVQKPVLRLQLRPLPLGEQSFARTLHHSSRRTVHPALRDMDLIHVPKCSRLFFGALG